MKRYSNQNSKLIFLIDQNVDIKLLKNKITKKSIEIISFDYKAHKNLINNQIIHKTSEEYLLSNDLEEIQKNVYEFTKWYEKSNVSNILDYDGINLGKTFFLEFHLFLISFLKKFVELIRISKNFPKATIFATSEIFSIAKMFYPNIKLIGKNNNNDSFTYDKVKINISKTKSLNISMKNYKKIKNFTEKSFLKIFHKQILDDSQINKVLLCEFNPIKFKNLLTEVKKFSFNFVLYNRRRPYFWNLESLKIIQNSPCSIISEDMFSDKYLENKINESKKITQEKFSQLSNEDDFFTTFFQIFGVSFWKVLKPKFLKLTSNRIIEAAKEIEIFKQVISKNNFSSLIILSESGFNEQIVLTLAKRNHIPVYLMQHGIYMDSFVAKDYSKFMGLLPVFSDKLISWGESLKNYALECGISEKKIEVLGCPFIDKITYNTLKSNPTSNVLIAISPPRVQHFSGYDSRILDEYEEMIFKICSILNKLKKKITLKLQPFYSQPEIIKKISQIFPDIKILQNQNITKLISSCDLFIALGYSTTIFEAQYHKKPVLSVKVNYEFNGEPNYIRTNSCITVNINDLLEIIKKIDSEPEFVDDLIRKGSFSVNQNTSNLETSSQKILEFLS